MKLLHTADWHLGARLHEQDRAAEHAAFLGWLAGLMREERPDALVVAGDIFDSCAPANAAQELYYDFLGTVFKESLCRAVVIIGGNHDSPSLLDSPEKVLAHLGTTVVGAAPTYPAAAAVCVTGAAPGDALLIAVVPYLRGGDLRASLPGEGFADRAARQRAGFGAHYAAVAQAARDLGRERTGRGDLPLILTGHCFLSGARLSDDQSERARAAVGGLDGYSAALLPSADYIALGHLHVPQAVGGFDTCRYAGSPLPMSFGEAGSAKSVTIAEFGAHSGDPVTLRHIPVPLFQQLARIDGTPEAIRERLTALVQNGDPVWVALQITGGEGELDSFWDEAAAIARDTPVRILVRQNLRPSRDRSLRATAGESTRLETLTPSDIFAMRLAEEDLTDVERAEYAALFGEICVAQWQKDTVP